MSKQGLISWARHVIAIDYGDGQPLAVRAHRQGTRISWHPVSLTSEEMRQDQGIVLAGIQPGVGMTAWLKTPLQSVRKVRQILPSVLDTKLPFPLEDCAYVFSDPNGKNEGSVPIAGEGRAALAVFARKSDLGQMEEQLLETDVTAPLFDHEGVALWSSVPAAPADVLQVIVWCRRKSVVVVCGVNGVYWSSHTIDGYDIERLMRMINLQKQTSANGNFKDAPLHWWIGGDEECTAAFCASFEGVSSEHMHMLPDGEFYLARVLAERALLPGSWRVAALAGERGEARLEKKLVRRYLQSGVLCILAALVLASVGWGRRYYVQQQLRQEDQSVQQTVNVIAGYTVDARGWQAVVAAEQAFAERRALLAAFDLENDLSVLAGALAAWCSAHEGYWESLALSPASVEARFWLPKTVSVGEMASILRENGYHMEPAEILQDDGDMKQYRIRGERNM